MTLVSFVLDLSLPSTIVITDSALTKTINCIYADMG
jgi:hypothetical protein